MVEDVFGVRYLYHATYLPYYKEIKKDGKIVAGRHKNWDMSSSCIYLARDEEVAISYAETSENVPEEYLDQIVVLTVDASKLDIESLDIDHNQAYSYDYDYTDTFSVQEFEYTKDIPLEYVVRVTRGDGTPLSNEHMYEDTNFMPTSLNDISKVDWSVVSGYSNTPSASIINDLLRKGMDLGQYKSVVDKLSYNMTPVKKPFNVYRTTNYFFEHPEFKTVPNDSFQDVRAKVIGKIFVEKGFVSTTCDTKNLGYGSIVEKIKLSKGTRVILTPNDVESEIIIDKGTKFKVLDVYKEKEDDEWSRVIVELETVVYVLKESDIGYHYGDLGKSEYRHSFGNRSTGGFGTGIYFVGTPISARDDMPFHKDRPGHKIDVSGYNLYKPKTNTEAHTLHSALLELNNVLAHTHTIPATQEQVQQEYDDVSRAYFAPVRKLAKDDYTTPVEVDESILRRYIDKYKKYYPYKITNEDDLFDIYVEVFERVLEESREFEHAMDKLYDALSHVCDKAKLYSLVRDIAKDKSDIAPSTLLMKSLGYDGIDVRHLNKDAEGLIGLDNSTYGSVLYGINSKSIIEELVKNQVMDNIKFLGYKPEFIENDRSYPEIVRAINSDKYYNMEEMLGMIRNAKAYAELNAFSKGYDKLYIDLIFDVDGTKKRWHGIRIDINDHSKPDEQFLDYARNIPSIIGAVFDTNDYSARYGNLSVFEGVNRDTIQEKDYKWIKLPFITKGTVFGKVGRRIGIAAPATLPSSEGPIPGPGATSGECSGCSESKLTEEWVNYLSEADVARLLELISDFIYKIEDNFMHVPEIHTEEVRDKVYGLYTEIYEYLKKYYPDSHLIKRYNLDESLKEDVSTSRPTLQQIFDERQLDGIDVYDTDYDVDGCYVPNIQTPADNYDAFVKYFCQNSYVDEYDDDYATVNFCDFIKNNKAALDEWLDIDPEWDEDDTEEYIVEQLITALAGNGSESQYREFMTLLQTK